MKKKKENNMEGGQYTETVKATLGREGINMFRKGGEKLEQQAKRKGKGKEKNEENMEEGVVYQMSSEDCEKIYIAKTKFTIRKRLEQHKKGVKFGWTSNAIEKSTLKSPGTK